MESVSNQIPFLEKLFATEFADVRFVVSDLPRKMDAEGFAYGNEVYLRPDFTSANESERLGLLAHELAHVVQFRQGRIPDTGFVVDDTTLEEEAELASYAAVAGRTVVPTWLQGSRPVQTSRERHILCRPDLVTNEWFGGKTRPDWAGNVVIRFEEISHIRQTITRPIGIYGLIAPGSTTGRGSAPEPICGYRVSTAANVPAEYRPDPTTGLNARNAGMIDAEKGHIMALELGGPDIRENIVPQWAKWQGCGEWRRFEKELEKKARAVMKKKDHYLMFQCVVHYFEYDNPRIGTLAKLSVPVGFSVFAPEMEKKADGNMVVVSTDLSKTFYQQRDQTDDMIALRAMNSLEQKSSNGSNMTDLYTDVVELKRKGKIATQFAKTGQDARYAPPPVQFRPVVTPYLQTVGNAFAFNSANAQRRIVKAKRTQPAAMDTSAS